MSEFEVLVEWTIRKLKLPEKIPEDKKEEIIKRWMLYSLGLDEMAQDIYLYLEKRKSSTSTEIAKKFNISPNTARKYLDDLHTVGLVDYIGREYRLEYETISKAIELSLIPKIVDVLKTIARISRSIEAPPSIKMTEISKEGEIVNLVYFSPMRINNNFLETFYREGKRIRIKCLSHLKISADVDPELAKLVIAKIEAIGSLDIPSKVYASIPSRIKVVGPLNII